MGLDGTAGGRVQLTECLAVAEQVVEDNNADLGRIILRSREHAELVEEGIAVQFEREVADIAAVLEVVCQRLLGCSLVQEEARMNQALLGGYAAAGPELQSMLFHG